MAVRVEGGSVVGRIEGEDWDAQEVVEVEKKEQENTTLDELGAPVL